MSRYHSSLRITAGVLVLTFLNTQVVWAADVRQMLLDAKASFDTPTDERRSSGMDAETLQTAQTAEQAAVDQQNALQELQNMNFSLTTQNGDLLKYVGDTLSEVQRPDGTVLNNIQLDADGNIAAANLRLSDGSVQVFNGGKTVGMIRPDGTAVEYDSASGRVLRTVDAQGKVNTYSYELAADGSVLKTTVVNSASMTSVYGPTGLIEKIIYPDASELRFLAGKLSEQVSPTGARTAFTQTTLADGQIKVLVGNANLWTSEPDTVIPGQTTTVAGETVFPIGTLDTTTRGTGWVVESGNALRNDNSGRSLIYTVSPQYAGDLRINMNAINAGSLGLPTSYTDYQIEAFVDGVSQGVFKVPANTKVWKAGVILLKNLSAGSHQINLVWKNDYYTKGKYDANIKLKDMKFTSVYSTTVAGPPVIIPATQISEVIYAVDGSIAESSLSDGTKFIFSGGVPVRAFDKNGIAINFAFAQSLFGNVLGSSIEQGGLKSDYDAQGRLSSVTVNDLTIHYKSDAQAINYLEKSDGTEIWDVVFDAQGAMTDGIVYTPDGEVRIYKAGHLEAIKNEDLSQLYFQNDQLFKLITPEKITYDFSYTPTGIEALIEGAEPPDALTPVKMMYDSAFNLKQVIRQNREIIHYLNDEVEKIEAPNEAEKVFRYVKDANGDVLSYSVVQANVETFYDANNQPLRAVISPTAANPHTLDVRYQYGKIRDIKKDGVLTFTYAYSFDVAGQELLVIKDLEEYRSKNYKNGQLLTDLDENNSVLSSYSYANGKVSKVDVTRFGRTLHSYDYAYAGDDTVVRDEEGVVRTYNAEKKLLFLERDAQKFQYSYHTAQVPSGEFNESSLPVGLYDTTARSVRAWQPVTDNQAWYSWEAEWGKDYLVTYWGDQWVEYSPNMTTAGDLRIDLEAVNSSTGGLPAGYTDFELEVFVDGASHGIFKVPAHATDWQQGSIMLKGLTVGSHVVRIKWLNDGSDGVGDANFKFRNLSMTEFVPVMKSEEIVEEVLIHKTLADGSVAHYDKGQITTIDLADGTTLTNVVLNSDRTLARATMTTSDGTEQIFNASALLEEIKPDGTHLYYDSGKLSKVTDAAGNTLDYSYDKDALGNVTAIWVKKGSARLKYSAGGDLTGAKLDGILSPAAVIAAATHGYTGGGTGSYSIDGDYNTAQTAGSSCGGCGGSGATLTSTHTLNSAQIVTSVSFKMYANGYASGNYIRDYNASYNVQVLRNNIWEIVSGSANGSSGGGNGSSTVSSGVVALTNLNLTGVTAVRAFASGHGNASGGEGNSGGSAAIYEIQFTLADLSSFSFNGTVFTNAGGSKSFNDLGVDASFARTPNFASVVLNAPPALAGWQAAAKDAILAAGDIAGQEYSSSGIMETQTKADGTVTLFDDNNKPSMVLDRSGEVLIKYSYDADGHPSRVYLKNARDTLPGQLAEAKQRIEEQRAAQLLALAKQKGLAYQSIFAQADTQKTLLSIQLQQLQTQYNSVASMEARGSAARGQRADSLGQIDGSIATVRGSIAVVAGSEADAYAALDAQVKTVSDQIEADAGSAFTALAVQESELKKEIVRQEVSPIIYDYYRRILGRDPSSAEYDSWITKTDYDSGADGSSTKVIIGSQNIDPKTLAFKESAKAVSVETENFHSTTAVNGRSWTVGADGYLTAGPEQNSSLNTDITNTSPRADYKVNFANAGTYYLWIRGYAADGGSDSVHVGIDGALPALTTNVSRFTYPGSSWTGKNAANVVITLTVAAAGEHTINFWMREDGFKLDKFVLTQDAAFVPSGAGPAESGRVAAPVETKALTVALAEYLNALPELAERQAYVTAVKVAVKNAVNAYLAKSDTDKAAYAATLGLAVNETIPLSAADAQKIIDWLDSRSLHFGQSAFLSLEALLDQKGITYSREDLATKCILTDILAGIISPLDDGDLVISVFALNKVAGLYSLDLSGAKLDWTDIQAIFTANPDARVIAHINGNHYVIVTNITADSITYIDPGIGKDKQNESLTVTKTGFMKAWRGNVTLETATVRTVANYQQKLLSAQASKDIRGAFWGSLLNLIGTVLSFTPLAPIAWVFTAASLIASIAEGNWMAGLSSLVSLGFANISIIGDFFKGAFQGITNALGGVGAFFGGIYNAVTGFINSAISFLPGIGSALQGAAATTGVNIGAQIVNTALSTGITIGVSRGLESLGVNPQIAGFVGTLVSGGIIGGMTPISATQAAAGVTQATMIRASVLQTITLQGVGQLGLQLGLDSGLTNIIGLSLGAIQGNIITNPGTTLQAAFNNIKPQLFSSLAQYGIDKLGTSLGLDSRVSGLIGTPISAALNVGFQTGGATGAQLINAINLGIQRGITNLAIDAAGQALNLNPLFTGLTARSFLGALEGTLQSPGNPVQGLFQGLTNSLTSSLFSALTFDQTGAPLTPYQQALYLQRVQQFSQTIQNQGLEKAINDHLTAILQRDAVESVIQQGGIAQLLTHQATPVLDSNNQTVAIKINIDAANKIYLDPNSRDIVGRDYGNIKERGTYAVDPNTGEFKLVNGRIYQDFSWGFGVIYVKNGIRSAMIPVTNDGNYRFYLTSRDPQVGIILADAHFDAVVTDIQAGTTTTFKDGQAISVQQTALPQNSQQQTSSFGVSLMPKVSQFYQDVTQLVGQVASDGLKSNVAFYTQVHGFAPTAKVSQEVTSTIRTQSGIIEITTEEGRKYVDGNAVSLIGKTDSNFNVNLEGEVALTNRLPSGSITVNALGQTSYQGINFQLGGFGRAEGSVDDVSGHSDILANPTGLVKLSTGIHTEQTSQDQTIGFSTYREGNSIVLETELIGKAGDLHIKTLKYTPQTDAQGQQTIPSIEHNMSLLNDLMIGTKTQLTVQETVDLTAFMKGQITSIMPTQSSQINLDALSAGFASTVPQAIQNFTRQTADIILSSLASNMSGVNLTNPVNLALTFGQSLLQPLFPSQVSSP